MKRYPEKRVVITGAGSGLGRALALEFARMRWRIAIAEINGVRAKETAALVEREGGEPLVIHCDVTKPADLEKTLRVIRKKWGGVDILVNNAGVAAAGFFEKIPLKTWEWILAINLKSIIYGCRTFIPLFKEQGHGYIVNVASGAGLASLPEMGCYNVTKAGAVSASETLRVELSGCNIGVSVVCPTFFKTHLMDQFTSPEVRQRELAETFFRKSASTAEAIAKHIVESVRKNRFYIITQRDGRVLWYLKRHFPELYFQVFGLVYGKGLFDKYLGLLLRILNFGSKMEGA
jgi:NAD(P)-dependent dehydrogenase (short-subunit alcohol dehydrogenase family)